VDALGRRKPGEVALLMGVSASSVSEWKNQGKSPSLEHLLQIAN